MARIAIDARIINSGTGRYIERLLHHLEQIDNENEYLILVRKKDLNYYKPGSPNFKIVEADFKDYSFGEQLGFAWLLYRLRVDLVHFCMPQQPLLYFKKSITTVHDLSLLYITKNDDMGALELKVKQLIFRGLLQWVARKNKHILTPSNYTKQALIDFSHISPGKITVTYEGADIIKAYEAPAAEELEGKKFIMYVGRAEPYKNNRLLIETHQKLLQKYPELWLVIVGRIDILRRSDQEWVSQNNYQQVMFTDFISDGQLLWLYHHTAAYVFPSLMEGFGLPGVEAMGAGAPVVSSNSTCLPEVLGAAAEYFDPKNLEAIAAAIDRVISNETRRQELISLGTKQAAKYSWRKMAEQTLAAYKKLLET